MWGPVLWALRLTSPFIQPSWNLGTVWGCPPLAWCEDLSSTVGVAGLLGGAVRLPGGLLSQSLS